jgi:hypothetical protein
MIKKSKYFKKSIIVFIVLMLAGLVGFLGINGSAQAQNPAATNSSCEAGVDWCAEDCSVAKCPDGSYKLQVGIPGIANSCKFKTTYYDDNAKPVHEIKTLYCVNGFPAYVRAIYNFFIGAIGIFAVIMVMLGGFRWLLAAGNAQKIAGAKTIIISAIMGMVLALASYSILYIANPVIKDLDLVVAPLNNFDEGESLGWCKRNMDLAGKTTTPILRTDKEKGPQCGKKYLLKDQLSGEDVFCSGFECDKGWGQSDPPCVKFDVASYKCADKVIGIIDDKMGYGSRNWKMANTQEGKECGTLWAQRMCKDIDECPRSNIFIYSGWCKDDDTYCLIDATQGVEFDMSWDSIPKGFGHNQVGYFVSGKGNCVKY